MGFLTGKKKSKSVQDNKAYNQINTTFSPVAAQSAPATSAIAEILGIGKEGGFKGYLNSAGYDHIINTGSRAISNTNAGRGVFNSGATAKALQGFGQGTGAQFLNGYIDKLLGLSNAGLGAGGLITQAGQQQVSTSKEKGGLAPLIGSALSAVATGGTSTAASAAKSGLG